MANFKRLKSLIWKREDKFRNSEGSMDTDHDPFNPVDLVEDFELDPTHEIFED